jgi:hypothetical protein
LELGTSIILGHIPVVWSLLWFDLLEETMDTVRPRTRQHAVAGDPFDEPAVVLLADVQASELVSIQVV